MANEKSPAEVEDEAGEGQKARSYRFPRDKLKAAFYPLSDGEPLLQLSLRFCAVSIHSFLFFFLHTRLSPHPSRYLLVLTRHHLPSSAASPQNPAFTRSAAFLRVPHPCTPSRRPHPHGHAPDDARRLVRGDSAAVATTRPAPRQMAV